jgi:hypothetical protein
MLVLHAVCFCVIKYGYLPGTRITPVSHTYVRSTLFGIYASKVLDIYMNHASCMQMH